MFKNPGEKIKILANIFTVIGCIVYAVLGVMSIAETIDFPRENTEMMISVNAFLLSIFISVFKVFCIWVAGLLLYAFGDLVEDVAMIRDNTNKSDDYTHKLAGIADEFEKGRNSRR